ncbi:MAG: DUF3300 domain-containing protein [Candidatus Binatia bacterium]
MHIHRVGNFCARAATTARRVLLSCTLLLALLAALAVEARAQAADTSLTRAQLEQLVAPIALYPDSLLAQVLMASTYPLEIVQAARWVGANSKLKGKALEDALQPQPWDPSVKSIVVVPQVLQMMNDKLDWTEMLGNAFLAQQDDLLKAVQDLRTRADAQGTLKTTSQQKVSKQSVTAAPEPGVSGGGATTVIVIESADPQVMYVPTYDPGVTYGTWPYPSYPPYYWYPPGYVASNLISFGVGVAVGAAIWGNCNWGRNQVNINVNNFNSFNRTNIANGNWQHNVDHRKGVPYANSNVAERFGQKSGGAASAARDQFRGRAEGGQLNLGNQGAQNRIGGQAPGQGAANRAAGGAGPAQGAVKNAGAGAKNAKTAAGSKTTAAKTAGGGKAQNKVAAGGGGANAGVKALDGVGSGQKVRQESARGASSRTAMASAVGGPNVRAGGGAAGGGVRPTGGGARAGGGAARGGGGGGRRSDLRLKHDIILLGRLDDGLGFYRFSYNGSDKAYVGIIAQEVQAVMPQAVARDRDGYLRVFYDRLGLSFQTYDRWIASGAHIPAIGRPLH